MSERTRALLAEHALVAGSSDEAVELVAEAGEPTSFGAGTLLLGQGSPADVAYLVTKGRVALEVHAPGRGPLVGDTMGAGHVVGLSRAAPPFRYQFDARVLDDVEAVVVDASRLRVALAGNLVLGLHLLDRLAGVVLGRLQATRIRLLDFYGPGGE
ncbi:MAG TPA: Crp/Fnr family transcriptional regulator [Acidimicrobiales bacterium]|nr:Crp/Fnr family transcriptional regulator [Acidimicrobiales bacterium]